MFRFVAAGIALFGVSVTAKTVWPFIAPKVKGYLGEAKVRRILSSFKSKDYANFNDVLIPGSRNSAQLDHILVSRHGIFVFETKNYAGKVTGGLNTPQWTHFPPHGKERPFLNPLLQNKTHVKALRSLLRKYPGVPIYNIVVFPDHCSIPALPDVVKVMNLKLAIKARCRNAPVLSTNEVQDIRKIIDKGIIKGQKARDQHDAKAKLAADAARNVTKQDIDDLIARGKNSPLLYFGEKQEERSRPLEQQRLTDAGAILNIRGQRGSIEDIFEAAKRDADGNCVARGANFDHFICPYTGDRFPASEAKNLYQGLWISFLTRNPDLIDYLHEHGSENLGGTFRCQKVLDAFERDSDSFIAQARNNAWYRNMESKMANRSRPQRSYSSYQKHKPLSDQISGAENRRPKESPAKPDAKSIVH